MINKAFLEGNLTFDCVKREHAKNGAFITFTVANEVYGGKNEDGTAAKHVNFVDCVMFGNRAAALANLLKQGTRVVVEGNLRYSSWEKDGVKKSKIELRVDDISLPNGKKASESELSSLQDEDIPF